MSSSNTHRKTAKYKQNEHKKGVCQGCRQPVYSFAFQAKNATFEAVLQRHFRYSKKCAEWYEMNKKGVIREENTENFQMETIEPIQSRIENIGEIEGDPYFEDFYEEREFNMSAAKDLLHPIDKSLLDFNRADDTFPLQEMVFDPIVMEQGRDTIQKYPLTELFARNEIYNAQTRIMNRYENGLEAMQTSVREINEK